MGLYQVPTVSTLCSNELWTLGIQAKGRNMSQNSESRPFIAFLSPDLWTADRRMAVSEAREFRQNISKGKGSQVKSTSSLLEMPKALKPPPQRPPCPFRLLARGLGQVPAHLWMHSIMSTSRQRCGLKGTRPRFSLWALLILMIRFRTGIWVWTQGKSRSLGVLVF